MGFTATSPNMNLVVPVVGQELGPQWATDLYNALYTTIDQHNHTSGNGVQIPTAALLINADLPFAALGTSYNATSLRSARFTSQGSPLSLGSDVGCLYSVLGNAYWNDGSGNQIQLTKSGSIATPTFALSLKSISSGTTTILSTDTFALYYIDASGGTVTVNLPASSALAPGRAYFFVDIKSASESHAISVVPNGTDKINGANATFTIAFNGTSCLLTTDGAGNWAAQVEGAGYLRAAGLKYSGTFTIDATSSGGVLALQANDTTYAFVSANASGVGLGIGATPGTDPTITRGTGIPATTQPNGSIFLRTDGTSATGLYSRQSGAWGAIGGGLSAPVTLPTRTNSASAIWTVDTTGGGSDGLILHNVSGATSYIMPTQSGAGRYLVFRDETGAIQTLANNVFLVPNGADTFNGSAGFALSGTNYHFTNGSQTVTATSSHFTLELAVGMSIQSSNQAGVNYIISAIGSDTSLTLSANFTGTTTTTATSTRTSLTFAANNGTLYAVGNGTNWTVKGDGTPTTVTYTANFTFIPPQGVFTGDLLAWGGGGGGGGAQGNTFSISEGSPNTNGGVAGSGGGSAIAMQRKVPLTPSTAYAGVIGVGGAGGAGSAGSASTPAAGSDGGSGTPTTFGTIAQFLGGSGGRGGSTAQTTVPPGLGWTLGVPSSNSDTTKNLHDWPSSAQLSSQGVAECQTGLQSGGFVSSGGTNAPISFAGNAAIYTTSTSNSAGGPGGLGTVGTGANTQTNATTGGGGGAMGPGGNGGNGGGGGGAAAGTSGGTGGAAGTGGNGGSVGGNATTTAGGAGGAGGNGVANSGAGGAGGGGSGNSGNATSRTGGAGGTGGSGQLQITYVL